MNDLMRQREQVNEWMRGENAHYTVLRQGIPETVPNPFNPIPSVLPAAEFSKLEQGLLQRICALNLFLGDIYGDRMIIRDGVIPEEFVYASPEYRKACMHFKPIKTLYNHLSATDLVKTAGGEWFVMQDNLSFPRGAGLPHLARKLCRQAAPNSALPSNLCDNCGLDILLNQLYRDLSQGALSGGIPVLLLSGQDDDNDFEIRYFAKITGAVAARPEELTVMEDAVYYRAPEGGGFQKVAVVHRLAADDDLDPLCFNVTSRRGVPHLMEAYRRGRVAIVNAPGCSIADDRGLYYFVPAMIRYYLGEEPLLENVPTWLPWYGEERRYILDNLDHLIIKDVSGDKPIGSVFGGSLTEQGKSALREKLIRNPRRYVAQTMLDVAETQVLGADGATYLPARADLRFFTVHCDSVRVWMGGLTRCAYTDEQGQTQNAFQDTWVLSEQEECHEKV